MHSGSGDNHAIGGVAQSGTEERSFFGDFDCKRKNVKARIRFEFLEYLVKTEPDPKKTATKQHCYLEERDGADRNSFRAADCFIENPRLFPRKPLWIGEPANEDMGVQEYPGRQVEVS